jgi:protease-4
MGKVAGMDDRKRGTGRVLTWVGLGLLVLILLGSLLLNLALLTVVGGQGVTGSDPLRFREITVEGEGSRKAVLIPVKGFIGSGYGDSLLHGRGMTSSVISQLRRAARDGSVKAVILEIDSPGGGVGDSDLLYHEVNKVRALNKPVVSCLQDVATSGAYYVAAASDRIIAQPTTITGNIGVILHGMNVQGLFDKIGVRDVTIKKGEMKDILSPTRPITPEEEQVLQDVTDAVYNRFLGIVASARKLDEDQAELVGDGRIFAAQEALEAGLVDAIGYRDDALAAAAELAGVKELRLIRYEKLFSFKDILGASSRVLSPSVNLKEDLLEATSPRLMYLWTMR